jgi:hypothetical protein
MSVRSLFSAVLLSGFVGSSASAAPPPADQAQYAPYKFLIGTWDVSPETGGAPVAKLRFRWGPNHTYIWYAQSLLMNGQEHPHFEGMLMWNGVHKNLDMLLAVDLQYGLAQEEGTFAIQADGSIVREITTYYSPGTQPLGESPVGPGGELGHFRQTYKPVSADKVLTTVMHETKAGWVPTFPGSDHLAMTRANND